MIRHFRRTVVGLLAAGTMAAGLTACAAPTYTYATDSADQAYFKVPSGWPEVSPQTIFAFQLSLGNSLVGTRGGTFTWVRAYAAARDPSPNVLMYGSRTPVVYASVHSMSTDLRQGLSFNQMRNLIFPITPAARQAASAAGFTLPSFDLLVSNTITNKDGVRGINEVYGFVVGGDPLILDQTVLTNSSTTKLYLLMVQCDAQCFNANVSQIKQVVDSFTVRGS